MNIANEWLLAYLALGVFVGFFAGLLELKDGTHQQFVCTLESDDAGGYAGDLRNDGGILQAGIRISP